MALPEPAHPKLGRTYNIIVTGVGGTGIVTIGGILGMAAHLEGKGVGVIDMAGLAQKGGAVYSHMRIAERPEDIHAIRVAAGGADLVLGGDIVVAGNKKVLSAVKPGTAMVINTSEFLPGDFTRNADFSLPTERLKRAISGAAGQDHTHFIDASRLATALFGTSLGANIFMVGFAYQLGALPLSADAIEQAIALNGEAVPMNLAAFHWGRRAALDRDAVEALAKPKAEDRDENRTLVAVVRGDGGSARGLPHRLSKRRYARRYRALVDKVKAAEAEKAPGQCGLAEAVARYLFKLMAYKDEYEVARLYTDGNFLKQVANELGGDNLRFEFHLAPPLLAKPNPATGEPRKISFGPVDDERVQGARPLQVPARHAVRHLRLFRGAQDRAQADRRLRGNARRNPRQADARQSSARGRSRRDPGEDPRLRSGQGPPPRRRQGRRGGAAGAVPFRQAAAAEGRRVA